MKITKQQLKKLIQEELSVLSEGDFGPSADQWKRSQEISADLMQRARALGPGGRGPGGGAGDPDPFEELHTRFDTLESLLRRMMGEEGV